MLKPKKEHATFVITAPAAVALGLLVAFLSVRVSLRRGKMGVALGDGGDTLLLERIRQHCNLSETIAMALILMGLAKASIAAGQFLPHLPDWPQVLTLFEALVYYEPTPVVQLNLAVAMAENGRPQDALELVQELGRSLLDYQPFHAVLADLARRLG